MYNAQQLPKSGSISFHTGWKAAGEALTVAGKHVQGHRSVVGVTFNDKGEGPLHLGAAECFLYCFEIDGRGKNEGFYAFGDADGDRLARPTGWFAWHPLPGSGLKEWLTKRTTACARASGVLMLLFTDRYHRSCARLVGRRRVPAGAPCSP